MHRAILLSVATIALTGCHTVPAPTAAPQQSSAQLQAKYDAANKRYQSACFHNESDADISAALHGAHARRTAPVAPAAPDPACTAAKTEMDRYEAELRSAINAEPAR